MSNPLSDTLIVAFRKTHYRVTEASPPFTLLIDEPSPELARLYRGLGVRSAAFLTAFNPFSVATSEACNAVAQGRLQDDLTGLKIAYLNGIGIDPSGAWPGEVSLLALGLSAELGRALAGRYGQHAFVWCAEDATPRLALMRVAVEDIAVATGAGLPAPNLLSGLVTVEREARTTIRR